MCRHLCLNFPNLEAWTNWHVLMLDAGHDDGSRVKMNRSWRKWRKRDAKLKQNSTTTWNNVMLRGKKLTRRKDSWRHVRSKQMTREFEWKNDERVRKKCNDLLKWLCWRVLQESHCYWDRETVLVKVGAHQKSEFDSSWKNEQCSKKSTTEEWSIWAKIHGRSQVVNWP